MEQEFPLITVGIVVLNRGWIIGRALASLQSQTYPHDRIFVLVADSESTDNTVETAKQVLEKSDFKDYEIMVQRCSIPEGRNMCIKNMRGDLLLFWDSDVVMEPDAISLLFETMKKEKAGVVTASSTYISITSVDELENKLNEAKTKFHPEETIVEIPSAGMGHTLISKEVLKTTIFDPDLTIWEDGDFSLRAMENGFRIVLNKKIEVFDVNITKQSYSDIHIDMPLRSVVRGMRKKARTEVLVYRHTVPYRGAKTFFLRNKRYVYYLGYIPTIMLSLLGLFLQSPITAVIFPVYLFPFALWQFKRRGFAKGLRSLGRSFLVGLPTSFFIACYFAKYGLTKGSANFKAKAQRIHDTTAQVSEESRQETATKSTVSQRLSCSSSCCSGWDAINLF